MPSSSSAASSGHFAASNSGTSLRKELRSPSKETLISQGQVLAESGAASTSEPFRPIVTVQPLSDSAYISRHNILIMDFIPANTSRSKIKNFFSNQQHGRGANPSRIEIFAFPISGRARSARVEFSTRDEMMQALSDGQEKVPSIFLFVPQDTIEEVRMQLRGMENDVAKQLMHMSALKDRGEWRSCLAFFAVLETSLTPEHYHMAMQACEICQKGDVADALLNFMAERQVKTELRTIQSCVRACCTGGFWEKAVKHLESIINAADHPSIDPSLFDLLSACLGSAGQWERALEIGGLKHANDSRSLRSSLIDEWRTFKQQNEEVFSFCRAALTTRSGFPDAFRELVATQKAMSSEFIGYSRDFEELSALLSAHKQEHNSSDHEDSSTLFE
jgi:hypothetical protein